MQRLRQLSFVSLGFLFATSAWALPGELKTRFSSTSTEGQARVGIDLPTERVSRTATTVSGRTPTLWNEAVAFRGAVTTTKNDYSTILLRDRYGTQTRLSDKFDQLETSAEVGADLTIKSHSASVGHSRMLSDSPYSFHAWNAGYNYGFFGGTTIVGVNYTSARQEQPLTYFIDPREFRNRLRPESLTSQRFELFGEQVLTERWKIHVRVFQGARFEDRPKHWGGELRNAYALSDRWYLRLDTGALRERKSELLKDERGRYSVYWAELQVVFEPVYDLLLTAALGTTVEHEDVDWENVRRQIGSDNFSLRASYRGTHWNAALSGTATISNTNYRSRGIQGEFTWEI